MLSRVLLVLRINETGYGKCTFGMNMGSFVVGCAVVT